MSVKERVLERLHTDFPYYAEKCLKIVGKDRQVIPFRLNAGQRTLYEMLEAQRQAGKPQRAIALKARQIGCSTLVQGLLIHRSTLTPNHAAIVVAHDTETGGKLYRIGERMYRNLPDEEGLKPELRSWRKDRGLHFGERGSDAWQAGDVYPDSTYLVDTAGEFEAGRGGTYHSAHLSEFAHWPQPETKLTGLAQAIPDDPDSLIVIESTANGMNLFKDLWDDAEQGRSAYAPFFWPWWKQDEYSLPFLNEAEREQFEAELGTGIWGEDEPELMAMICDFGYSRDEALEKLNWRRWAIPNKTLGKLSLFHQEYPSTPTEAFLTTGDRVFEGAQVRRVLALTEITDPKVPTEEIPGPAVGVIREQTTVTRGGRVGPVQVPTDPAFVGREKLAEFEPADWRVWLDQSGSETPLLPTLDERGLVIPERPYVVACDVSGGLPESEEGDPAYHAMAVIDHETKEQVCEYRSRCDPDLFADHAYLTALLFNQAWLAIEVTGAWGLPIARRIWGDYRYPYTYMRRKHDAREDSQVDRLGWDTNRSTKPVLLAGGQELLREGTHGIKSRVLANELLTYVRLSNGKTAPERGKFADLLMAWLIAQQVALEQPLRKIGKRKRRAPQRVSDPVTGYTAPRI